MMKRHRTPALRRLTVEDAQAPPGGAGARRGHPPGGAAAGVSAVGAALGALAVLGPWCFKDMNDAPALCLALVEAARPRGSAACAVARPVDDDERTSLVGGPAWHVMETAAACLSALLRGPRRPKRWTGRASTSMRARGPWRP